MTTRETKPVVLTIAGFDPSGGAGIIADIRTIESLGCTAVAAITSVTFQNAEKFFGAKHQSAASVRAQVEAIIGALTIAAVKIGMLPTAEVVRDVARLIRENDLPAPVIDPVMESTSGGKLMLDDAFEAFVNELMPLARVVTPNIPEAERLANIKIENEPQMGEAVVRIRLRGARAVMLKGGHAHGFPNGWELPNHIVDILDDDGRKLTIYQEWIDAPKVRGTGCMLSSAIAACLAKGSDLKDAVTTAKQFVSDRIRSSN